MGRKEVRQNRKGLKYALRIGIGLLIFIVAGFLFPTWTPKVEGENSICEFRKVEINGEKLQIMIRGCDRNNPILLFVHGGPCCSEIPYVGKYQKEWEEKFTIVHYDQRGSGKSFEFFKDYSRVSADIHVEDLTALTEYLLEYLGQEKVILLGHSYGTYIGLQAASQEPEIYQAYVGIGQMSNTIESELDSLERCILAAEAEENATDVSDLKALEVAIESGEGITPRQYVRKYGFAARGIDDNLDYVEGFLLRPEYNLLDMVRFYTASIKHQDALIMEAIEKPLPDIVTEAELPVYFLMGKYDGMTSPEAAENYLNHLECQKGKELVIFGNSAHYPQFEECDVFYDWLCEEFLTKKITGENKMGLFNFLGKHSNEKKGLVAIAKEISADDKAVVAEIEKCLKDTESYVEEKEERFDERGFRVEDVEDDAETVRWLALVDILEENKYVCERDWKDELTDFTYFVGNLKGVKSRELPMEQEWFREDGDVVEWCKVLDEKWAAKGMCVAAIDIESDSYVLFPYEVDKLEKLCDLAEQLEHRIDFAKNM